MSEFEQMTCRVAEAWEGSQESLKQVEGKKIQDMLPAPGIEVLIHNLWEDGDPYEIVNKAIDALQAQAEKELHQPIRTFLKILFRRSTIVSLTTLFTVYARTDKHTND